MRLTQEEWNKLGLDTQLEINYFNGKPVVRVQLQLRCDRVRIRDHTMPKGYRCFNHYYYQ